MPKLAGSVTRLIDQVCRGDPDSLQRLWERYFQRLVRLARLRLRSRLRRAADEEDIALKAFHEFWLGASRGRFPELEDRESLWRLLVAITGRKAANHRRDEQRQKRGGPREPVRPALADEIRSLDQLVDQEPTPEFAAQLAEEYERLLARLPDADMRRIAVWKMTGYTNEEIAVKLDRVPRTVERKLEAIRSIWTQTINQ